MASTTADQTLVSGAYAAAGGNIKDYNLGKSKALSNISDSLTDLANVGLENMQEKYDKFTEFADAELARDPGMRHEEYKRQQKDLNRRRREYVLLGKQDRQMMIRELNQEKIQKDRLYRTKKDIASKFKDNEKGFSNNEKWIAGGQGQDVGKILSGEIPPTQNKNGDWGWVIDDGKGGKKHFTDTEIKRLINDVSFDKGSKDAVDAIANKAVSEADNAGSGDIFNYDSYWRNTKNNVVNRAPDLRSLNEDPDIIPGRVFKNDLIEMLENNTYESLGVKYRHVKRFDPTPETKVTPEDAKIIAEQLLQKKRLNKQYLTTWITNYAEQNYLNTRNGKENAKQNNAPISVNTNRTGLQSTYLNMSPTELGNVINRGGPNNQEDDIMLYSEFGKQGGDVEKAKEYNMLTYGTHNPTLTRRRLNITKEELAARHKKKIIDDINNDTTLTASQKVEKLKKLYG